jgi:hypothetical protein
LNFFSQNLHFFGIFTNVKWNFQIFNLKKLNHEIISFNLLAVLWQKNLTIALSKTLYCFRVSHVHLKTVINHLSLAVLETVISFCKKILDGICTWIHGTRSFDQITFFRNSKFSFEFHSFEIFLFFSFFRIRVLSKKKIISKDNRTKNNLYKWTKIFFRIPFFWK